MFFQPNTCGYSAYVTSCLARGWVCRLQLLLVLASAIILRRESRGTHDHISLSQIRDSHYPEGQVPVFIFPGTGWPNYITRHWVPFRRLLRLAELRWRFSNPPPHGFSDPMYTRQLCELDGNAKGNQELPQIGKHTSDIEPYTP
jgi:hypothetical protein